MKVKAYIISKEGEEPENCQDAYEVNKELFRYAVADGATREFFSAKLAQELVKRFCFDDDEINRNILNNEKYEEWLEPIQKKWLAYIEDIINNKKVNFVVKNRFNRKDAGASTFVGLELNMENFTYKAMIIGDSCLFHIRNNEIIKCYLIDDYQIFDNSPDFFFSRKQRKFTKPKIINESFKEGDYFLLATDAISKWFLIQKERDKWKEVWNGLLKENRDWYNKLISENRQNRENKIDDDDVTILIVPTNKSSELIYFPENTNVNNEVSNKLIEGFLQNTEEEKKEVVNKKSLPKKDIKENSIIDSSKDKLEEEHQEIKDENSEERYQQIFFLMYKEETNPVEVCRPYFKEISEKYGFKFISQKEEYKIDKKYQKGIIFFNVTSHDSDDYKRMHYVEYYKFSKKELEGYEDDKKYDSYTKKMKEITYCDMLLYDKIPKILKENRDVN